MGSDEGETRAAQYTRRAVLERTGRLAGAAMVGAARPPSRVVLVATDNRASGTRRAIDLLRSGVS